MAKKDYNISTILIVALILFVIYSSYVRIYDQEMGFRPMGQSYPN